MSLRTKALKAGKLALDTDPRHPEYELRMERARKIFNKYKARATRKAVKRSEKL